MSAPESDRHAFLIQTRIVDGLPIFQGDQQGLRGHRIRNSKDTAPDGVFVQWHWDGFRLTVENDRHGFFPVFYCCTPVSIALSNSIDRLLSLCANRDLDDVAIAAFLRLGFYLGNDTPFTAIKALGPQSKLEWTAHGVSITSAPSILASSDMTRRDALLAYRDLFRAAISRRGAGDRPLVLPLSGGRDSRHILLELCHQNLAPDVCVTAIYPPAPTQRNEIEVAQQLCAALNIRHETVAPARSRKATEIRKNRLTNYSTLEHGWFMPVTDRLDHGAQTTYDGVAGDVLSAGLFLTAERDRWFHERNFSALFADMQVGLTEPALKSVLKPDAYDRFTLPEAIKRFAAECLLHVDAPNPVGSLSFFNRTRRVACLNAYAMRPNVQCTFAPYLDNDLFDLLSSLPATMFMDYSFHTDAIKLAYPKLADIPYSTSRAGCNFHTSYRHYAREVLWELSGAPASRIYRKAFVATRLMRCLADRSYSPSAGWLCEVSLYLMQLEHASN